MSRLVAATRMSVALLAVVVLSALCAAEATLAATPRWQWQGAAGPTRSTQDDKAPPVALWSAAKDRDASQPRCVRSDEPRAFDDADVQDRCHLGGPAAIFADRAMLRAQQLEAQRTGQGRAFIGKPQLGPHRLSLPPPRA